MNRQHAWVVCERSGRWAAALRIALARRPAYEVAPPRLREVRSLGELDEYVREHRRPLCLIEVRSDTFDQMLAWLADTARRQPAGRFVAVLADDGSCDDIESPLSGDRRRHDVIDALREAGALEVAQSPRHMRQVLTLADRHWAESDQHTATDSAEQSLTEWVASRLPWQE